MDTRFTDLDRELAPVSGKQAFGAWLLIGAIIFAGAFAFERERSEMRARATQLDTEIRIRELGNRLEMTLNSELVLARALVAELSIQPDLPKERFEQIAAEFKGYSKRIRNIGYAKGSILSMVHPAKGNEAAIGLDYSKLPAQWPAVKRVIDSREAVVAGPINLVQGGTGIISRTPIYGPPSDPPDTRRYIGLISIVVDLPQLLMDCGITGDTLLNVALRGKDGLGAQGAPFHGDPDMFAPDAFITDIHFPGGSWQLTAMKRDANSSWGKAAWDVRGMALALWLFIGIGSQLIQQRVKNRLLRDSERNFRLATSAADELIYDWRPDSGSLRVSDSADRIFGQTQIRPQSNGKFWCTSLAPNDRQRVLSEFDQAVSKNDRYSLEYRVVRKDGDLVDVWDKGRILRDKHGKVVRCVGSVTDISEKLALERKLRQTQKLEAIGALAGGIAHDFNNILMAIVGNVELLKEAADADPKTRRLLDNVMKGADRATILVGQILTFSRGETMEKQVYELNEEIAQAIELLRAAIPRHIDIVTELPEQDSMVVGDPVGMHQALINLCTNASHAIGSEHGRIQVVVERVDLNPGAKEAAPGMPPGPYARISVSDNGGGMDEVTLDRVFEPFFTTKELGKGTGLGLSIVHGIVRNHGGTMSATSRLGEGSEFNIWLPTTNSPRAKSLERLPEPAAPPRFENREQKNRVLLVDDEKSVAMVCEKHLIRAGFEVGVFHDTREALACFEQDPDAWDVILTDLSMPGMTGLDLARRTRESRADIPVVLISGNPGAIPSDRDLKSLVNRVIGKPLPFQDLSKILQQAINSGN